MQFLISADAGHQRKTQKLYSSSNTTIISALKISYYHIIGLLDGRKGTNKYQPAHEDNFLAVFFSVIHHVVIETPMGHITNFISTLKQMCSFYNGTRVDIHFSSRLFLLLGFRKSVGERFNRTIQYSHLDNDQLIPQQNLHSIFRSRLFILASSPRHFMIWYQLKDNLVTGHLPRPSYLAD